MAHAPGCGGERRLRLRTTCPGSTVYRTPRAAGRIRPHISRPGRSLRRRRNRDRARDDLGLELLDLRLVRVDLRVRRRVADAVLLQTEPGEAGLELPLRVVLDEVEHRSVDALERRGQDQRLLIGRRGLVLVGVVADRQLVLLLGGLEQTAARAARCVIDDVRTVVVLTLGDDLALGRVVEAAA